MPKQASTTFRKNWKATLKGLHGSTSYAISSMLLMLFISFFAELPVKAAPWYDSWSTWISESHFSEPSHLFTSSLKIFVTIPIRCNSGGGDYTNTLISSELLKIAICIESQNCLALLDLSPESKKFRKIFIRELKVLDMPLWFRFSLSISHHAHRSFDPWPI